jgi:hypothetical protein
MQPQQNANDGSLAWYRLIQRLPYMPDWIEDAAKRLQEERARRKQNDTYREALRSTLSANSKTAFSMLLESVARDVVKFNALFPEVQQKLQGPDMLGSSGFQIKRSYDPVFILTVRIDSEEPSICWNTVRSNPATGHGLYADSGSFELQVEKSGDNRLARSGVLLSFEAAAKELLLPALEGLV